jgi:hypothetical protein
VEAANIHAHLLRHSFGDHIAQHAGLRAAQALMGHASVETTARVYTSRPGLDELAGSVQGFRYRDTTRTGEHDGRIEARENEDAGDGASGVGLGS